MAAVKRQLKITATTFQITSTRPMPSYSPPSFRIRTTACQASSSGINTLRNAIQTSSTTFSNLVVSLSSTMSNVPSSASFYLSSDPDVYPSFSPSASVAFTLAASPALCSCSHSQRCSVRIWKGPHNQCSCSLLSAYLNSSSLNTVSLSR